MVAGLVVELWAGVGVEGLVLVHCSFHSWLAELVIYDT